MNQAQKQEKTDRNVVTPSGRNSDYSMAACRLAAALVQC
jgi:hypothetical protein